MKCQSIACLWPSTLHLSHLITSSLALASPPSLYTGASNGSIFFWYLPNSNPNPNPSPIQPLSVLCGHSSPITSLSVSPSSADDIISASSDGVLCVWTPPSHRCRRRRRLPPWAGSPSLIQALASQSHQVCVLCVGQVLTVLIVDSSSLNAVRTIAHGALGIGTVSSMVLVGKDAILVDGLGKVQFLKLEKELNQEDDADRGPESGFYSVLEGLAVDDGEGSVAISQDGKFLALILEIRCVFKLVTNGTEIGEASYVNNMHHPTGGMFLQDELGNVDKFVVWSSNGAAAVYSILSLEGEFKFELLCEVPAVEHPLDERSSVRFCQFKSSLVRMESSCFESGGSLLWEPNVAIWSIPQSSSHDSIISSMLLGEGGFLSCPIEVKEGPDNNFQQRRIQSTQNGECTKNERTVSSSMVLLEDAYAPYAVIYGFYNGDIEVVRFINLFPEVDSPRKSEKHHSNSCTSEQFFSGHTGAILCLAA